MNYIHLRIMKLIYKQIRFIHAMTKLYITVGTDDLDIILFQNVDGSNQRC